MKQTSPLTRQRRTIILLACGLALLVAAAFVARTWVPVWFHLPVSVTVNDKAYKVASGTKVSSFLDTTFDLSVYQGELRTDKGQVLDPRGGKPARIIFDGAPLRARERIMRDGAVIKLIRGADIVHGTAQKSVAIAPGVRKQGKGSLVGLLQAGKPGAKLQTVDTVTGKVLSSKDATAPVDALLQVYSTLGVKSRVVALTFDDGPWKDSTAAIVAILKQQQVKATFFELGTNIKRYPAFSRAVVNGGSLIGLHSWDHKDFTKLNASQIDSQVQRTQDALKAATGQTSQWFRLPYGASTNSADGEVVSKGFHLAFWTVDTNDWSRPGVNKIVARAVAGARPGAVILMHDGGGDRSQTVAALPKVITALKAKGYSFVTVDELYRLSGGK